MHARSVRCSIFLAFGNLWLAVSIISAPADIPASAQRQTATRQANELSQLPATSAATRNLNDPFNPNEFHPTPGVTPTTAVTVSPTGSPKARTQHEMLMILSQSIQTTGSMMVRGTPTLVIKKNGKQVLAKVGDSLPVAFEGTEHTVVVTAIDRETYTIEWNGEKATRSIRNQK